MYSDLIKKYRRKKLGLLILVMLFALPVIGIGLFSFRAGTGEKKVAADYAVFAVAAAFLIGIIVVMLRVFINVPRDIRRMQDSVGLNDDEAFAEMISTGIKLPCKEDRFVCDGYFFDMVSFRAYRLEDIYDVRKLVFGNSDGQKECKVAVIFKDGSQNIIYTNKKNTDEVYRIISDAWKKSTGAE
ncbi:MAG: hypothetical protein IKH78_08485 [Ruminococcus sp.]|nr:hypothetical protein [Ruminococcus sp.]